MKLYLISLILAIVLGRKQAQNTTQTTNSTVVYYPVSPYRYYWDNFSQTFTYIPYNYGYFNYYPVTQYYPTSYWVKLSAKEKLKQKRFMKKQQKRAEMENEELTEEQKDMKEIVAKRQQLLIIKDLILKMDTQARQEISDLLSKLK